ncbi:MAG: hypothetical protein L3K03_05290 [Thermoplasmata archaeon]|nr:hypothetical protein [Thermoplasmata archaeon]
MATPRFRSSASFGKRQEFVAIAELLKRGFDVYQTLVDDQGIDCILREEDRHGHPRYIDLQVKARSRDAKPSGAAFFSAWKLQNPRENYYFLFFSEQARATWIIPTLKLDKLAHLNKAGKNAGKRAILLANVTKGGIKPRPKFIEFQDEAGFDLLRSAFARLHR